MRKIKGYKKCSVKNCRNTTANSECSFFRFPKDNGRTRKWIIFCNHPDLMLKTAENLYATNRVCSHHFEDRMYANDLKNRLLPSAYPTLNTCSGNNENENIATADSIDNAGCSTKTLHNYETDISKFASITEQDVKTEIAVVEPTCQIASNTRQETEIEIAVIESTSNTGQEVDYKVSTKHDKVVQTTKKLSSDTPRKIKLRKECKLLKKKNTVLQKKLENAMNVSEDQFLKCCDEYLPPEIALFVKEQVLNKNKKMRGQRYSKQYKGLCLNLFFKGRKTYTSLSSIFLLPSRRTLNRMTTNIFFTPGINKSIFQLLSIKVANMQEAEKYCTVMFDEMSLKSHLYYDVKADEIIGFSDNGEDKQFQAAKLVCVFVARSIFGNWKQSLAYVLSNTACPSTVLQQILKQCIVELKNIGLKVVTVVCDMGSTNIKLAKDLEITSQIPYFTLDDQQFFFIFNIPHLLKATRNMFLKYIFIYDEFLAKMEYVKKFYEIDKNLRFRLAPKLTDSHIAPSPFEKMKTRRATQLLSQSVVAGINTYIHFEKIPDEAIGTVTFIDKMDKLFDMLNSTEKYNGEKLHAHVFKGDDSQLTFLQECLTFFEKLKVIDYNKRDVTRQMKFIDGWKVSISAVLQIWNHLNKDKGFPSLQTRRLNQDVVENLFGKIRAEGGNCLNLPTIIFIKTFKKLLYRNFFNSGNENCEEDFDKISLNLNILNEHDFEEVEENDETGIFHDFTSNDVEYRKLNLIEKNSIRYICGHLIRKCLNKHSCAVCEEYSIEHVESEDSTISCFFKAYQSERSAFGSLKMPHNNFIFYICSLEAIFNDNFETVILQKNVIQTFLTKAESIMFQHPCQDFPHLFVKKLFFRMRLYYTLKFINRNFKSNSNKNNSNKMIIWKHL